MNVDKNSEVNSVFGLAWASTKPDREDEMKEGTVDRREERRGRDKKTFFAKNGALPLSFPLPFSFLLFSGEGSLGGNPNTARMLSLCCISSIPPVNLIDCGLFCCIWRLCLFHYSSVC